MVVAKFEVFDPGSVVKCRLVFTLADVVIDTVVIPGFFAVVVVTNCVVDLGVVVVFVVDIVVGAGVLVVDGKCRSPSQLRVSTAFALSINKFQIFFLAMFFVF